MYMILFSFENGITNYDSYLMYIYYCIYCRADILQIYICFDFDFIYISACNAYHCANHI